MHPDVLYIPEGFLGYPYWMACTPYPFGKDHAESPIIRVSADGVRWQRFPGAPDPLISGPADPSWHHADTDLVLWDGVLHLFFISTRRPDAETTFSLIQSQDAIHWTPPFVILREKRCVSPAVIVSERGQWQLWYVRPGPQPRSQISTLYRRTATHPAGFGSPQPCSLDLPAHVVWHLDILATPMGYEALVTAFPDGTDPSRSRLFHAKSPNGIEFTPSFDQPLLKPSWFGWDNRMVYRSTFVKRSDDSYRVWYSAASWGMRCGIGLLEGRLSELRSAHKTGAHSPHLSRLIREDVPGFAKYLLRGVLPPRLYSLLLSARNRIRALVSGQP